MSDERLDFSALDPARDRERWERRIQEVVARAVQARRWSIGAQLSRWSRPALALAAAAALFSTAGLVLGLQQLEDAAQSAQEAPSSLLLRWAVGDETPSARRMLSVLGEP